MVVVVVVDIVLVVVITGDRIGLALLACEACCKMLEPCAS